MRIRKLAAIDIGSNAIRMLINYVYEFPDSAPVFNKASLVRMPIRLGQDVFIDNKISDHNLNRILSAMKSYKLMMDVYGVEDYIAYATSAMRTSENGKEVMKKIKQTTGLNIQIIDGDTEARLIFASELNEFMVNENNYLFVDVGGGSTELTLIKGDKVDISKSFEIGSVRLMEGKVAKTVYPEMKKWVETHIRPYDVDLIGSGGNINNVFKYSGLKADKPLPAHFVRKFFKTLRETAYQDRLREFNMKPDRADVIDHALEIYVKVLKWTRSQKIYVPKIGISDGMIRLLYEEIKDKD